MFKEALAGPPVHRDRITPHRGCHMRDRLGSECALACQHHTRTAQQKAVQQKPRRHAARLSPAVAGCSHGCSHGGSNPGLRVAKRTYYPLSYRTGITWYTSKR